MSRKRNIYLLFVISSLISISYFSSFIKIHRVTKKELKHSVIKKMIKEKTHISERNVTKSNKHVSEKNILKYILVWTRPDTSPFIYLGKGQSVFITKKCQWSNCYVTDDRNLLGHYCEFEVIAFNGPELHVIRHNKDFPMRRTKKQKYVYANIESASTYPICDTFWDGFFNWTWTYKLKSDVVWGYLIVKDRNKNVVGPRSDMHWINLYDMEPIDENLVNKLKSKTKAAAWFVSNCITSSLREEFVAKVKEYLKVYGLDVDVYGDCGEYHCPKSIMEKCLKSVEKDYYFYFAFENAFSEDYVTEKIVYALNHFAVPVVYGGANYSRFMPHGIYLNARDLGPQKLAQKMYELIQNPTMYYTFFRWRNHYSYHFRNENPGTDDYCRFCAIINEDISMKTSTIYNNFKTWWTAENYCRK